MLDILEDFAELRSVAYERIDGKLPWEKRKAAVQR